MLKRGAICRTCGEHYKVNEVGILKANFERLNCPK